MEKGEENVRYKAKTRRTQLVLIGMKEGGRGEEERDVRPGHCGLEQTRIETKVLGHSLVRSLVRSHRSLVRSLTSLTPSLMGK